MHRYANANVGLTRPAIYSTYGRTVSSHVHFHPYASQSLRPFLRSTTASIRAVSGGEKAAAGQPARGRASGGRYPRPATAVPQQRPSSPLRQPEFTAVSPQHNSVNPGCFGRGEGRQQAGRHIGAHLAQFFSARDDGGHGQIGRGELEGECRWSSVGTPGNGDKAFANHQLARQPRYRAIAG
jgi:hypothetical protein